jgi:hypothetical protein
MVGCVFTRTRNSPHARLRVRVNTHPTENIGVRVNTHPT